MHIVSGAYTICHLCFILYYLVVSNSDFTCFVSCWFNAKITGNVTQMLFKGFPEKCDALKSLRDGALATSYSGRWSTEWETHALPLINQVNIIHNFNIMMQFLRFINMGRCTLCTNFWSYMVYRTHKFNFKNFLFPEQHKMGQLYIVEWWYS